MVKSYTQDAFENAITGVGGSGDKTSNFVFVPRPFDHNSGYLSLVYEGNDLAATIVDAVVDDSFKDGWSIEAKWDPLTEESTRDFMDRHNFQGELTLARKWSRLYGGGALFLGCDDAKPWEPLHYGGNLHFVQAYDRDELQPARWHKDPLRPNFGKPSHYRLTPQRGASASREAVYIHDSRLIIFDGVKPTNLTAAQNNGWGLSVLERAMKPLEQFSGAHAIVLSLLGDANQNIYKMKDFAALLRAGQEDVIRSRMKVMDEVRSAIRALVLDAENEDFVRSQLNLSGIDDILDRYAIRLAAAAKMPVSRLLGEAPKGFNSTGESDQRNWNSQVLVERLQQLQPALEKLLRVMFRAANGPTYGREPETWSVKWGSLWSHTPREQAEIDNLRANTFQTHYDIGTLTPEQIARTAFSGDTDYQAPLLSRDELEALKPAAPVEPEVDLTGAVPTETDGPPVETADGPEDEAASILAEQMTAYGAERCEHGYVNRCPRCGVERVRGITGLDETGKPIWKLEWRPIGAVTLRSQAEELQSGLQTEQQGAAGSPGPLLT